MLEGGKVVEVAAAAVVGELSALFGDNVEVETGGGRAGAGAALLRRKRADVAASGTATVDDGGAGVDGGAFVSLGAGLAGRADHQLAELVSLGSAAVGTAADAAVALAVLASREVVAVTVAAVVLEALAFLSLGVVEVSKCSCLSNDGIRTTCRRSQIRR